MTETVSTTLRQFLHVLLCKAEWHSPEEFGNKCAYCRKLNSDVDHFQKWAGLIGVILALIGLPFFLWFLWLCFAVRYGG